MTRLELIKIVVGQARTNGFELRRWYTGRLGLPWINADAAFIVLAEQRRYYALLFSHEFASSFWKPGSEITFQVDKQTFQRTMPDGSIGTVTRKPFTRRSARKDVWRYHLREMATVEEPLRYIRKYLRVEEDLDQDGEPGLGQGDRGVETTREAAKSTSTQSPRRKTAKKVARPLPTELPGFLRRPYP